MGSEEKLREEKRIGRERTLLAELVVVLDIGA